MGTQPRARRTRRRFNLAAVILIVIATGTALLTLLGLAPLPSLPDSVNSIFAQSSSLLIQWVTVVGALAVILGVLNLLAVHVTKFSSPGTSGLYSLVTLLAFTIVIAVHIADRVGILKSIEPAGAVGDSVTLTLMDVLQVSIESALAGLLTFFLIYAAFRLMRRAFNGWNVLFIIALLIVLVGYIPLSNLGVFSQIRDWVLLVPVSAGTRGILIGVALATTITGIRLLLGQERSLRE